MKCSKYKCDYNDAGTCGSPDDITISDVGSCNNMIVTKQTLLARFHQLENNVHEAHSAYSLRPGESTGNTYTSAMNDIKDFCVEVVSALAANNPGMLESMYYDDL